MARLTVGAENGAPIELYYEDYGDGRPVVLLHGWPLGSHAWEHQVPSLVQAGYRVITYDRRGSGRSSRPWGGYDYDTLAADLHALVTHLNLADIALVAASAGSGQAIRFIRTYGEERIRRLAFLSAPPPYLYHSYDNPHGRFDDRAINQVESAVHRDRLGFLDHVVRTAFRVGGRTGLVSAAQRSYHISAAAGDSPKGTLDFLHASIRTDFRTDLTHVTAPALVLQGGEDAVFPPEPVGHRTHDLLPRSRLVIIPDAPHALNVTHPGPVNQSVLAFLNG